LIPGEAAGVGEVIARGAAAATINAGIRGAVYEYDKQRGVSKANRGGSAFSFQDLGVDITATAVTAGLADELKVTDVNNQLVNAFTRSAKNIVVKDLIARAVYDDYDDYLEKQGGSFLFRTLQGGLTNYTNTALATYSPQEQTKPGEEDLYDIATGFFFGAEDILAQNNQLAALQRENSQPSGPPEGAPSLNDMQASAYGIEPGAIVDVGAGNILGGIDGVSFNENMRARLGVETVGLSDLDALPITTDSPDSLAYLEASNRLSVAGSDQTSHTDAQYLEDAIASGDVLVRGFNETEAVITNEALSYGDVSSKEYEIDYADYESINQATYELDLFDFDVANGFAESKEINPFTQLFGDISSSLTEYGNYASVSFDEFVSNTDDQLDDIGAVISTVEKLGANAVYKDIVQPFEEKSLLDGVLNILDRAYTLPKMLGETLGSTEFYDEGVNDWDVLKSDIKSDFDNAIVATDNKYMFAAGAVISGARAIGFGLIDTGVDVAGLLLSDTVRTNAANELRDSYFEFKGLGNSMTEGLVPTVFGGDVDYRLTGEIPGLGIDKNKGVLGTDFFGFQHKNINTSFPNESVDSNNRNGVLSQGRPSKLGGLTVDKVTRVAFDHSGNGVSSVILESTTGAQSIPIITYLAKTYLKADIGIEFGLRENLTTNEYRNAINFKIKTGVVDFGFEWRGKVYKYGDDE